MIQIKNCLGLASNKIKRINIIPNFNLILRIKYTYNWEENIINTLAALALCFHSICGLQWKHFFKIPLDDLAIL